MGDVESGVAAARCGVLKVCIVLGMKWEHQASDVAALRSAEGEGTLDDHTFHLSQSGLSLTVYA